MKATTRPTLLQAALDYAQRGWSIIPIRHRDVSGKQPTVAWKSYQSVRPTIDELREWFRDAALDGLAVICGAVSGGLYCRDFDAAQDYHAWAAAHPKWAARLPTVKTARGFHVYAVWNDVPSRKFEPGELRSDGHYVLLPPSRHPSGATYEWLVPLPDGELPRVAPEECGLAPAAQNSYREADCRPRSLSSSASLLLSLSVFDARVQDAIRRSLPESPGRRNERLFFFARLLKSIPELTQVDPIQLKPFVRAWFEQARPNIGTQVFGETLGDFVRGWPKIRVAADIDPLEVAKRRAIEQPLPPCAHCLDDDVSKLLLAICVQLQEIAGDGPFFLSCRSAGELLGISASSAGNLFVLLQAEGLLKLAAPGTKYRAARYRYLGEPVRGAPASEPDDGDHA